MSNYNAYWFRFYERHYATFFAHEPWLRRKEYPVPGAWGDTTHQCLRKFEKWYARPTAAHRLYWRMHGKG